MPTPRVIHILAVCCCVNIDIAVCGTCELTYTCVKCWQMYMRLSKYNRRHVCL